MGHPSRPSSRNAFDDGVEPLRSSEAHLALHHEIGSVDSLCPGNSVQSVGGIQNNSVSGSQTFASVLGSSLSRSNTPDSQLVARAPSPCLPPVGVRLSNSDKNNNNGSISFNRTSSGVVESDDLVTALSGMSLSTLGPIDDDIIAQSKLQKEMEEHQNFLFGMQGGQNHAKQSHFSKTSEPTHASMLSNSQSMRTSYPDLSRNSGGLGELGNPTVRPNGQVELHRRALSPANSHAKATSASFFASPGGSPVHYQNINSASADFTSYGLSGYSIDPASPSMMANHIGMGNFPPLFENALGASPTGSLGMDSRALGGFSLGQNLNGAGDLQNLNKIGNQATQMPPVDPLYIQYLRSAEYLAGNFSDLPGDRGYTGNSYLDLLAIQKQYLGLLQPQKQYGMPFLGKSGGLNHGYYGNPAFGLGMTYPGSPVASPVLPGSPGGPGSPLRLGERSMRFPSGMRNLAGGVMGSWHPDTGGTMNDSFASSLLEEFKSNKTKSYELSEIAGHVVEFRYNDSI